MKKSDPLWIACDKLCGEATRLRDNGICRICGKPGSDPHHIIPRAYAGTTFMLENRLWVCRKCHSNEVGLQDRCVAVIGLPEFYILYEIAQSVTQLRKSDLLAIREKLTALKTAFLTT